MLFKQNINLLKIITATSIIGLLLLNSCNSKPNHSSELKNENDIEDTINTAPKSKNEPQKIKIDSVKMHAFDNLYFGIKGQDYSQKFSINEMEYVVESYHSLPTKGLCHFMLKNQSKITTQQRAKKVLNDLKKTISKKYKSVINLNKTYYIKHPEEKEKDEFGTRDFYNYDKKIIGLPYEFVACKWDLKYKEIQIGYFIDHKNKTLMFQSTPTDDYYIIYIEVTSKIIKPEDTNSSDKNKDSNKF